MTKKKKSLLNLLFSFDQIKNDVNKNKKIYQEIKEENLKNSFQETFDEAIERLNLSEDDLKVRANNLKKTSRIFYLFGFLFLLANLIIVAIGNGNIFQNAIIIPVISLYMFLLGFRFSFNKFQIEARELKCLNVFIKKPKKWII